MAENQELQPLPPAEGIISQQQPLTGVSSTSPSSDVPRDSPAIYFNQSPEEREDRSPKYQASRRSALIRKDDNRCPVIPVFEYLHELSFLHFEKELEAFSIALRFDPSDASPITTPASLKEMRETLQHYSQAVRDYRELLLLPKYRRQHHEYSRRWILTRGFADDPILRLAKRLLPTRWTLSEEEWARCNELSRPFDHQSYHIFRVLKNWYTQTPGWNIHDGLETKGTAPAVEYVAWLILALVSGAALIVPMAVMVFRPSQTKSVVVAAVAVGLFAIFISFATKAENKEVLVATSTYAAVLVVFVGTTTGSR